MIFRYVIIAMVVAIRGVVKYGFHCTFFIVYFVISCLLQPLQRIITVKLGEKTKATLGFFVTAVQGLKRNYFLYEHLPWLNLSIGGGFIKLRLHWLYNIALVKRTNSCNQRTYNIHTLRSQHMFAIIFVVTKRISA